MKTTILLAALALMATTQEPARADVLTLHPTSVVHSNDHTTTYLQFNIPAEVQDGTILDATVSYESACGQGGVSVRAYEVQEDWSRQASALSDLLSHDEFINKKNPMNFDAADCSLRTVSLDISQVLRAWQKGTRTNYGMVVTSDSSTRTTQPESEDIIITMLYRPRRDKR